MVYPLHELKPGERAEIVWVISEPPMSLRLEELGFTAPALVTCILKGRRGRMSAYQIQDTGKCWYGLCSQFKPHDCLNTGCQIHG